MHATASRHRGRPRGITLARVQKQYVIAAAVIAGIKIADIARQLGVSRSWASREANSPAVRDIIGELIRKNWEKIERLFDKALDAVEAAMEAKTERLYRGRILHGGQDHEVRCEAVSTF